MDLDKAIKSRKSVREFKTKTPDWRDIIECVDAMRYAPMARNNYTPRIIIVDQEEKIAKLAMAAQQNFIAQCHFVVVVCSDPARLTNIYGDRGKEYCRQQAGAAIQNFLLKIEERGLATCWIGAFVEEQVKSVLQIPANIQVEAMFPIGFEFKKNPPRKDRINLDAILFFNGFGSKYVKMKRPKFVNV